MRKITEEAINAFYNNKPYKNGNIKVYLESNVTHLQLHNTIIAFINNNNELFIKTGGWNTNVTRERLNGLKNVHLKTVQGQLYLNKQKWDGNLIEIEQ